LCASILTRLELRYPPQGLDASLDLSGHQLCFSERQPSLHALRADLERAFKLGGRNFGTGGLKRLSAALNNFPVILHPPGLTQPPSEQIQSGGGLY
jgi:hypothetical protein